VSETSEATMVLQPGPDMSPTISELAKALVKAQSQMGTAKKDATNPHFKSKYADLASVWEAIRKPLADNGLSVVQRVVSNAKGVAVESMLLHVSGEWVKDRCWVPVVKADPQGYGSAITYARRYSLSAIVGVAADDDDGNAASHVAQGQRRAQPQASAKQATPPAKKAEDWGPNGEPLTEAARVEVAIGEAQDMKALDALVARIKKLTKDEQDAIRPVFTARKDEVSKR
jgi:hypothetical protein